MSILLHDGTLDGLLTAVAMAAEKTNAADEVHAAATWQPSLFENPTRVKADPVRVHRFLADLRTNGSARIVGRVLYAAMSEIPDIGTALSGYVRQVHRLGGKADGFLGDPHVGHVHEIARAVGRELHRLKGLVRFRELQDGTLWAPVSPDFNVISPLALYFRSRMLSDTWMVHDMRRRLAICWDQHELRWVNPADLPPEQPDLADDERNYQALWQTYFHTIAVRERRNPRLQRQFMPVRYWKHLVEVPTGTA